MARHTWLGLPVLLLFAASCVTAQQMNPPEPPSPPLPPGGDANVPAAQAPGATPAPTQQGQQQFNPPAPPSPPLPPGSDANAAAPAPSATPAPTVAPTLAPTDATTGEPTAAPTAAPAAAPATEVPSAAPAATPASGATADPENTQALLAQKAAFTNAGSVNELDSWKDGGNPCDSWSGVQCDQDGNVISLELGGLGLEGTLAGQLSSLSSLGTLTLSQNKLSGSLPGEWIGNNAFQSLTQLDLSDNTLDGDLPADLGTSGSFSGLQLLRLGTNAFTGSLPSGWGSDGGLGALQQLLLEDNKLSGSLPSEWGANGQFGSLTRLDVSGNDIEGSIPASWGGNGAFPSLEGIVLKPGNDQLCGAIPSGLSGKVLPTNNVNGAQLVCGAGAPAPAPDTAAAPPTSSGSGDTVGASFDLTGSNLVPWTPSANQTFGSALKFALGDSFNDTVIRYVGNVPSNSSTGRKLLQSNSISVYYNIEQAADTDALRSRLDSSEFTTQLQQALNENGVNVNGVTVGDVQDGGITVPGTPSSGGDGSSGLSGGAIAGIVIGALLGLLLLIALICLICCCCGGKRRRRSPRGTYVDNDFKGASQPIVRPAPIYNSGGSGSDHGGTGYYRRAQNSPTASPNHSGPLPQLAQPIILNADNTTFQGQRMGATPSPATSPYSTIKQMEEPVAAPIGQPLPAGGKTNRFSSWWTGRSAADGAEEPVAHTGPTESPYAPQINPDHDVELNYPTSSPAEPAFAPGGAATAGGGGSRVAEWLRPNSQATSTDLPHSGNQKKKLSDVVTDIDAI